MIKVWVVLGLMFAASLGAQALTGYGDSPVGVLDTVEPEFYDLDVVPGQATVGDTVTLTFRVTKPLDAPPGVLINGQSAELVEVTNDTDYTYAFVVDDSGPFGVAQIQVLGNDVLGNAGALTEASLLDIAEPISAMPVTAWPWTVVLLVLAAAVVILRRHRRGAMPLLMVLALCGAFSAGAEAPSVTNVQFTQQPDGAGGTQVFITYDLDAPRAPCDITVALSKDGGADGFPHPITSVTGDLARVTTGEGKQIVWDVAADYPGEYIEEAQIRVTAEEGAFLLTYTAGENGSIDGESSQWVAFGDDGSPVEAIPDPGYQFVRWSDDSLDNPRTDTNVTEDIAVEAGFTISEETTILLPDEVPLELVRIAAGSFIMGSSEDEPGRADNEGPQHEVTIASDFWMAKYAVTKQQWTAVMDTEPWGGRDHVLDEPDSPAVYVTWEDAQAFIAALNEHLDATDQGGAHLRLPSEAEWEYAARAGATTRFYWGEDPDYAMIDEHAWYNEHQEGSYAHVVGQNLPNAWGLYDMSGNVWEWCEDDYHSSYDGAPGDGSAWVDSPRGSRRVLRGGSWSTSASNCRSASRNHSTPSLGYAHYGFRLAR